MLIKGLQKVTLLDYPGQVACTIFTGGCNMRCPFCQNASLVIHIDEERLEEKEFFSFLKSRIGKLDAVCISGGEPCLQKDLKEFIQKIKEMGFLVKLDTNGCFPEMLSSLLQNHLLDYVAMDIKNQKEKYDLTSGIHADLDKIEESIHLLQNSGIPHEFRTTVVLEFHEPNDIVKIAQWVNPSKLYLQQFRDSEDVIQDGLHAYSEEEMQKLKENALKENEHVYLRGL